MKSYWLPAGLALLFLHAGVATSDAAAQSQIFLEANPVHGTLGYAWPVGTETWLGITVGFGAPQIDRTLVPDDDDLLDILHLGAILRTEPTRRVATDVGLRIGLAELHGCSGCLPGVLTSVSGGAFVGGRAVKVGARITAGYIIEHGDPAAFVLNLTPFALLFTYHR